MLATPVGATTLSGSLTVDNAFFAYVSTSDATLGTQVATGSNWGVTTTFSGFSLTPGQTYFLHIEAINQGGPGGFIGQFTLSDAGFSFANGSQTLVTGTTDWAGGYNDNNSAVTAQSWIQPTAGVVSEGLNGVGPWGAVSGISASADWIWPNDVNSSGCGTCTVDFSARINSASSVPEPASLSLAGFVLAGLCLKSMRRRES